MFSASASSTNKSDRHELTEIFLRRWIIRFRKSKKTDNTMARRKRTKGQTTIYKTRI
jgi:hypothetical protein